MEHHSGSVIESQVDWLTVSAHGATSSTNLMDLAHGLAKEEVARGARRRSWRLMGYEGSHVGRIEYGRRDANSGILRLIGEAADTYLSAALSLADTVTRVDLATTWKPDPPDCHVGRNVYAMAEGFHHNNPRSALPQRIYDARGGETVYLGARQSENFLRVYNKGAECIAKNDDEGAKRYLDCWRFELEVKGALAGTLAQSVEEREERAPYVRDYLVSFLGAHGIAAPFLAGQHVSVLPGFRRRSDAESRLRHLARNVRPTVDWLKEEGYLDQARRILGLD